MTNLLTLTCSLAVAGAVALGAQSGETTTKTKIQVKDGKDVKVTGCVEVGSGGGYVLSNVTDKGGDHRWYVLVSDNEDFSKHVGHRVQIEGKAADRGDGKVKIKSETKMEGPSKDTHSKFEGTGPYLGVEHMKMISASCP